MIMCLCDMLMCLTALGSSDFFFKIKLFIYLDTMILQILFLIVKINILLGDLSDISAKKTTLLGSPCSYYTF